MDRRTFLGTFAGGLLAALLPLAGCSTSEEKQWYKPNANYSMADFQRDQAECTKDRMLDEACLKQRGWIPLSADRPPAAKATTPTHGPSY